MLGNLFLSGSGNLKNCEDDIQSDKKNAPISAGYLTSHCKDCVNSEKGSESQERGFCIEMRISRSAFRQYP